MKRIVVTMAALAASLFAGAAFAEPAFPELNGNLVVDKADLLPPDKEAKLAEELHQFHVKHGPQIAVVTMPSLEGADVNDYGNRLFRHLKLGDAKRNDGVLLLIAVQERKSRIEVGYGLEGELTDLASNAINRHKIVPKFKQGDFAGGIEDGVHALEVVTKPDPALAPVAKPATNERSGVLGFIAFLFVLVGSVSLIIVWLGHRRRVERDRQRAAMAAKLRAEERLRREREEAAQRRERERQTRRSEQARLDREELGREMLKAAQNSKEEPARKTRSAVSQEPSRVHRSGQATTKTTTVVASAAAATAAAEEAARRRREEERRAEERRAEDRRRRQREEAEEEERRARRRREEDSIFSSSSGGGWGGSSGGSETGGGGSSGGGGDTSSW